MWIFGFVISRVDSTYILCIQYSCMYTHTCKTMSKLNTQCPGNNSELNGVECVIIFKVSRISTEYIYYTFVARNAY